MFSSAYKLFRVKRQRMTHFSDNKVGNKNNKKEANAASVCVPTAVTHIQSLRTGQVHERLV